MAMQIHAQVEITTVNKALKAQRVAYQHGTAQPIGATALAQSALSDVHFLPNERVSQQVRGQIAQLILQWALAQLQPVGERSWHDSQWRHYNVLHAAYFEGMTFEQIAALSQVSVSAIYKSRQRAIERLTTLLRNQSGQATHTVCEGRYLHVGETGQRLLRFLSLFEQAESLDQLLLDMAEKRQVVQALVAAHLIVTEGELVAIHPMMRSFVREQVSAAEQRQWEEEIGRKYSTDNQWILAARHWLRGGHAEQAAALLLTHAPALIATGHIDDLHALLQQINRDTITEATYHQLQLQLGDIAIQTADTDQALAAYRIALQAPTQALRSAAHLGCARAYRRTDIPLALRHYANCITQAEGQVTTRIDALIDRSMLFLQERTNLDHAHSDLQTATTLVQPQQHTRHAQLHNGWAAWYGQQGNAVKEREHQEQAWISAEKSQQPDLMMKMAHNLGITYVWEGQHGRGLDLLQRSQQQAKTVGDRTIEAATYKTIGASYALQGDYAQAIQYYRHALDIFGQLKSHNWQAAVYADLVEAYGEIVLQMRTAFEAAQTHATQAGADGLHQLLQQFAFTYPYLTPLNTSITSSQQFALEQTKQHGSITRQQYMAGTKRSKSAATRDLQELVDLGLFQTHGNGRATKYMLAR
ncbi:MAG: tetratricopeptide repeat protein [Candidatus Promineifilaceae bacterium]